MVNKRIIHKGEEIHFSISKNKLSKRLKISIGSEGEVKVSIPTWMPIALADNFVKEKVDWISRGIKKMKEREDNNGIKLSKDDYLKHKEKIRAFINNRVKHYNQFYNYAIGAIAIRNQKTRWGSCSGKGNLNFNYKVYFLPPELADYVIVHEICHLKEMNHSEKFWGLVEKVFPDYKKRRKELKKYKI